jgi:hypothetical protein
MQFTSEDGMVYQWLGKYSHPQRGDYFMSDTGIIKMWDAEANKYYKRAIVKPVHKQHVFGGVVFEETGEIRLPRKGEWFTYKDELYVDQTGNWREEHKIMRPLHVED